MEDISHLKKRAEAYLAEGKLDLARECYLEAIALGDKSAQTYHKLGEVFSKLKSWNQAVAAYCQALKINPNLAWSYHKLGKALSKLGSYREAIEAYKIAIKLKPELSWSYQKLGEALMKLSGFYEAIAAFHLAIEINPNLDFAYHNLGDAFSKLKKWDEAVTAYRRGITINPNFYSSYNNLGDILEKKGDFEEAIAAFNNAIKLNSNDWNIYQKLGDVYLKLEKWEEAIGCFIRALQIKLNYYDAFGKIADILKQQGKLKISNKCRNHHEIPGYLLEKFCGLTGDWAIESSSKQSNITQIKIYPAIQIQLFSSQTIDRQIHPSFQAKKVNSSSAYVATIPNGRALSYGTISAIISSDNKIVADVCKGSAGLVLSSSNLPPVSHIDGTVAFLSISPSKLYFFWMFYVVARIGCLRESGIDLASIDKFFVSKCDRKFQQESLAILGISKEKIEESQFFPHIKADRLIVPSIPHWRGIRNPKWACDFLKNIFLQGRDNRDSSSYSERIYISRQLCSWRRVINEEEVTSWLEKLGFTIITLETMPLAEQALCMANAKVVVAPHGAGLVNLVFCNPGTKAIEIFSPNYLNRAYWQISNICGLKHYYLIGEMFEDEYEENWEPNIFVNLKKLIKILKFAKVI